ncbi:ATP-binding protein [Fibrobacter sp. UWH4]|uniref:tRNA lysidine(34) synthetase n=1 Tax=Fibrobacter sp. UWH4 TaxID=1896210 RepID=UPI000917610C|nr:tRNA lysidine(34) synthetase [Fibrobacter sp. UWH4]SHK93068.1 tRNA(Ile)-lysidine synthase [Fibrobacter sp. UWH4]
MITDELASIKKRILDYGFKRLLLAVSGGLDSICLAHYFIANREALGIEWLGIAHVHHGLRVGTADRDAAFVEAFARKYNVPFFLKKLDGESLKNAEGSLEENARDARYKALVEIALDPIASARLQDDTLHTAHSTQHTPHLKGSEATDPIPHTTKQPKVAAPHLKAAEGCDLTPHPSLVIVTAHHAGDQAETMYMRLRRGTTLAGLRGIQEVRVLDEASHTPKQPKVATPYLKGSEATDPTPHTPSLYRPFLSVTREDLLAYARENNLEWCEDESNSDTKFARNFIRHEALPHLERNCPGATRQLCRIAELADKAYAKVMEKCNTMFQETLPLKQVQGQGDTAPFSHLKGSEATDLTPHTIIALNKKALRKIFLSHADADLSEMFRLWLSELGFRFPIGFFYSQTEPAHVKIPVRSAYRKRSIVKKASTVLVCEFEDVQTASKFVSCGMKE